MLHANAVGSTAAADRSLRAKVPHLPVWYLPFWIAVALIHFLTPAMNESATLHNNDDGHA
jgi:hypothetical protein